VRRPGGWISIGVAVLLVLVVLHLTGVVDRDPKNTWGRFTVDLTSPALAR